MSQYAIRIEGLGKQYRIRSGNGARYQYKSLRDSLVKTVRRPWSVVTERQPMTDENSFWALDDVSLEIKQGQAVGIIGRNGAGKSTLLKILSRITKPTTGQVELRGRVGSLLEVGTGFHPELSGRENIFLNGSILGMTRAEVKRKFDEIVAFSEVEKFLDTPVKQYSSGMYTRLAFAVAAHLDPEILIVDEVLAVGDATFQKKCLGRMKDVAGEGRTVLFVSHNMGAVRELCSSGCLLETGQTKRIGDITEVILEYMQAARAATDVVADEVPDQRFVGPARIHRCGVLQENCSATGYFAADKPIHVYAEIDHLEGAETSFGVRIRTGLGQEILHVTSQDEVDLLRLPDERSRLTIEIPPVPYNDGDYMISYFLGDRAFQMQHFLVDAVRFTVDNSHLGHKHASSPLKVSSRWSLESVAN